MEKNQNNKLHIVSNCVMMLSLQCKENDYAQIIIFPARAGFGFGTSVSQRRTFLYLCYHHPYRL